MTELQMLHRHLGNRDAALSVNFREGDNSGVLALAGFSHPEIYGTWTTGQTSSITISPPGVGPMELEISLAPFTAKGVVDAQELRILVGHVEVYSGTLSQPFDVVTLLPDELLHNGEHLVLTLHHPGAASPEACGLSSDGRQLAFLLKSLVITDPPTTARFGTPRHVARAPSLTSGMDYLAACTTVKNEGRYIYEWLSYHHALGVEHFYIYNNDSDDDTLDEIKRWPRPEAVTVIDWPGSRVQHLAYEHMAQEFRGESEWCAFIDADEFLCPQEDNAIPDILDYFSPQCSAVFAHWMLFGSSGYIERTPGLVTETFLRRGHDDFDPNKVGKTIVRLSQAIETDGVHVMRSAGRMINDSGEAVDQACQGIHSSISHRFFSLNHYFTKSLNEWRVRRALGRATQEPGLAEFRRSEHDFTSHDVNDVIDLRAAQIMEKCRGLYY